MDQDIQSDRGDGVRYVPYLVSQSGFGRVLAVALSELAKSRTGVLR